MDGGQLTFLVTRSSSSQHDGEGPSLKVQGWVEARQGFRSEEAASNFCNHCNPHCLPGQEICVLQ